MRCHLLPPFGRATVQTTDTIHAAFNPYLDVHSSSRLISYNIKLAGAHAPYLV